MADETPDGVGGRTDAFLSLVLNFSPIRFDDCEINVGQLRYSDDGEEVLKQLREEHNATHVFRREVADSILAVPVASGASLLGEPKTVRLNEHLGLTSALVRNAMLTYLAGMGRTVLSYDPLKFIARHDLLRVNPPPGIKVPDWLAVRLLYEVAVRPIHFFKQEPFVAAVLDVRTTRLMERSAWELMQDGFFRRRILRRQARTEQRPSNSTAPRASWTRQISGRITTPPNGLSRRHRNRRSKPCVARKARVCFLSRTSVRRTRAGSS